MAFTISYTFQLPMSRSFAKFLIFKNFIVHTFGAGWCRLVPVCAVNDRPVPVPRLDHKNNCMDLFRGIFVINVAGPKRGVLRHND